MSDRRTPATIQDAFPLLKEHEVAELYIGASLRSPASDLVNSEQADLAFHQIAAWMLRHPARSLGTCFPGLWLVREETIQSAGLSARDTNVLSRLGVLVWADTLELSPSILLDIQGFKEGNLHQFLAATAKISANACCYNAPPSRCPTVDVFERRMFPPKLALSMSELQSLIDWAINESGANTIADLIAACQEADIPDDIAALRDSLHKRPLADFVSELQRSESLEQLVNDLCGLLDQRSRLIFLSRISLNHCRTLENLADELGITRERVRQLHVSAESTVVAALSSRRYAPIAWRAHKLSCLLGTAVPRDTEFFEESIHKVAPGISNNNSELVVDILLWLAGPYVWDSATGWLKSSDIPTQGIVNRFSNDRGEVDVEHLREALSDLGIVPKVHGSWIDQLGMIKHIENTWLVWTGSVPDKAVRLLELWGEPATAEDFVQTIGEGHDVRSTRSRLLSDERMMRVDMNRIGLRSWGMEEYSGIADEIDQELERRGDSAKVGELISTLVERFGLSESSIRSYLCAPMFVQEDGTVRRRRSTDPLPPVAPVRTTANCYLLNDETLSWRVDVNADTLRGSGRLMPATIAGWLGVTPGNHLLLSGGDSTVRVTWPLTSATGPAIGSIRFLAETVGATPGDQMLLTIERDKGTILASIVDLIAVNGCQGLERLALLTGISQELSEEAFLHNVGFALGVRGTRAAISSELRRRGEDELASLIPSENASPELDAAIDALRDLF